jgi:hypothetical protein
VEGGSGEEGVMAKNWVLDWAGMEFDVANTPVITIWKPSLCKLKPF